MTGEASKKRLGRGLSALLGDAALPPISPAEQTANKKPVAPSTPSVQLTHSVRRITSAVPTPIPAPAAAPTFAAPESGGRDPGRVPVEMLRPGTFQPRRRFEESEMSALVDSIKAHGILQPIVVRPDAERPGRYEIVAGERRWRAAQVAGLVEVPVSVRALKDKDALEIALIENLQREGLSAIEEASGYRRLMSEFGHTQDALARGIGKSRSHVANMLRLLELPDEVKTMLDQGKLTAGHARALLGVADPGALAREVVRKGLNVRQTEMFAARSKLEKRKRGPRPKDADTAALEHDLSELLGLRVAISFHGSGGILSIHYANLEQLDDVLNRLNIGSRGASAAAKAPAKAVAAPAASAESELFADDDQSLDVTDFNPRDAGEAAAKVAAKVARKPADKPADAPELPSFLRRK
jgi:ParB family transcriptional regulator, chromosome partitioning protein